MNRLERRAAKKARIARGLVVNIRIGCCRMTEDGKIECFACGKEAAAFTWPGGPAALGYGIAEIQGNQCDCKPCAQVPLCETCFHAEDVTRVIMRKVWNAPDLEFQDGGQASEAKRQWSTS